jgi:[protein-PII] uridylyltransferase
MQMLSRVGSIYEITQTMADLGILSWILPEFGRLMDLIPYDASHDYTVGQHTLLVIHNIESVLTGSTKVTETEERAEMRRALEDLVHPEYLMLAALLHDTGKATPVSAHAEVSARIADNVCKRLGLSSEAAGQVRFLVLNHQLMGDTSRLRDLTMEKTIREFVSVVDDVERLNMLYLLTYADTRAVGEGIWTPVKGSFLRELWQRATAAIYDNEIQHCDEDSIAVARRNIKRSLSLEKLEGAEIEEHIEAMPPYYLLNSTLKEVALHISFVKRVRAGEVVIDFQDSRAFTELTICTNDDPTPGLLSKIAAALLAATLNVHSAKVVTRRTTFDSIALDTLIVDFKGRPLSAGKCKEVSYLLKSVLGGAKTISEILPANRSVTNLPVENEKLNPAHPNPPQPLSVDLINHDFDQGISLLEISGPTALVLFYKICAGVSALGWDIQAAKLSAARDLMRASLYLTGIKQMSDGDIRRRMMRSLEGTMVYREC